MKGAQYLVLPSTSRWWLDHYAGFRQHLEHTYPVVTQREDTCRIYSLCPPAKPRPSNLPDQGGQLLAEFQARFEREPAILDWHSGLALDGMFPRQTIFRPPAQEHSLPYLDTYLVKSYPK